MTTNALKSDVEYQAVLEEIERLFDAAPDTPEGDRLERLVTLVENYEEKHYSIPAPDPAEALRYYRESRGVLPRKS